MMDAVACRPQHTYRIFNTWMGEPGKVLLLEKVIEVIQRDQLLAVVQASGRRLIDGLTQLAVRFPAGVGNVRGVGTFCAFDCSTAAIRDKLVATLKTEGTSSTFSTVLFFKFHFPIRSMGSANRLV